MTDANLIYYFFILDEFCKYFAPELNKHMVDVRGKHHLIVSAVCPTAR